MPRERPYYGVAHLVLGGVASRLDLTVEHLEELELALDGLLDRRLDLVAPLDLLLVVRDLERALALGGTSVVTRRHDATSSSSSSASSSADSSAR